MEFHPKVTFLVGENGTGKSTLLEAIAVKYGLNAEGGSRNFHFSTCETHASLHQHLRMVRGVKRATDAYFLRAESFYNVATTIDELDEGEGGNKINSYYGGKSLHQQSHGESFFSLFHHRLRGNGMYVFDEPEAALSPMRQYALVQRIHELIRLGSQCIIASHSPIILAYPHADHYVLDEKGYSKQPYHNLEHVQFAQQFLTNPEERMRRDGIME